MDHNNNHDFFSTPNKSEESALSLQFYVDSNLEQTQIGKKNRKLTEG